MDKKINERINKLPTSCSFKSLLTSLKDQNYTTAQKIIKMESNKKIKKNYQNLVTHVRSIKTDVKYIKEDNRFIYEEMYFDKVPVKIFFYSKDIEKLTEFLSGRYFRVVVRKVEYEQQSINGIMHMIFNHADCRSSAVKYWLYCMVGVKNLKLFNHIKTGVFQSSPGFQPFYMLDFLNGYMEYKLHMAIQDFNRFLAERDNFLYCANSKNIRLLYKFKLKEQIDIILENPDFLVRDYYYKQIKKPKTYQIYNTNDIYPERFRRQSEESWEIEKKFVFSNAFKNRNICSKIWQRIEDKMRITVRYGNFSATSDIFQFTMFDDHHLMLSEWKEKYLKSQNKTNIYTGLYNGKYFQTWYIQPYQYPPLKYERNVLLQLIDREFYNYVTKKEGYNKYNISEKKRQEVKNWLDADGNLVPSVGRREDRLIDFEKYHSHGYEELMPPVKGFPENRLVQPYEEMDIDK